MDRLLGVFFVLLIINNVDGTRPVTYDRHKLIQIVPDSNHSLSFLQRLSSMSAALRLDFWTYPTSVGRPVTIHLEPNYFPELQAILQFNNISFSLLVNDLQRLIRKEHAPPSFSRQPTNFDDNYHSYGQIYHELRRLTGVYSNNSKLIDIGTSYEFRKIYAIEIFANSSNKKPLIFLNCGLHAREWISPATCMFIVRQLLGASASGATSLRNNFTWIILPVLNVDGYVHSLTGDRYWRKSRSVGPGGCIGVDLNRNFNHYWGGFGTSDDPCNMLYAGQFPFSEPETYALGKYLFTRRKDLKVFLDIHSYGQLFMSPWGHTNKYSPHYQNIQRPLMAKVAKAISSVYGRKYTYGPTAIVIYQTTGDAADWCYQTLGVVHSYSLELRPTADDRVGFNVPREQIVESGREILSGLVELARYLSQ